MNAARPTANCARLALRLLAMLAVGLLGGSAGAGNIEFIVDRADGRVFIKNSGVTPSVIDGYTVFSPSSALIVSGWTPIAGDYDASGDQSVDSISNWFIIDPPSTTTATEASLTKNSGSLAPGQIVSLGLFFDVSKLEGLAVTVSAGSQTILVAGDFRNLNADYDSDLDVDLADYNVFKSTYGSVGVGLAADGNGDGVVDAADYTVWRDSPELSLATFARLTAATSTAPLLTLPGFAEEAPNMVVTIPEPTAALLLAASLAPGLARRRAS